MSNQVEVFEERINQLSSQNHNFEKLLMLAKSISNKKSLSLTRLKAESNFIKQTLLFLNDGRPKICDKSSDSSGSSKKNFFKNLIDRIPQSDLSKKITFLEADNIELRKKLMVLLEKLRQDAIEMENVRNDHELLKQVLLESKHHNFIGVIQVPGESVNVPKLLHIQQAKEKIKKYLLQRMGEKQEGKLSRNLSIRSSLKEPEQDTLEKAHFKQMDSQVNVVKKEVESKYHTALGHGVSSQIPEASIILQLEKERAHLLSQLQQVLENSTKQIAEEYFKLQDKIIILQKEKDILQQEVDQVLCSDSKGDRIRKISFDENLQALVNNSICEKEKLVDETNLSEPTSNVQETEKKDSVKDTTELQNFNGYTTYSEESNLFGNVSYCSIL